MPGTLSVRVPPVPTDRRTAPELQAEEQPGMFALYAFLRIGPDNLVTVISKHIEVGQDAYTGLATILAEELDADWSQVRVEPAPADDNLYKNLRLGMQLTCCSASILPRSRSVVHRRRSPRSFRTGCVEGRVSCRQQETLLPAQHVL